MRFFDDDVVIIMCGSRTWKDRAAIREEAERLLLKYGNRLLIRHGDEPNGADAKIYSVCEELLVRHIEYRAKAIQRHDPHERFQTTQVSDWMANGYAAGPIRNRAMRDAGAQGLVAFRMGGVSKGTDNMIALAKAANIPVIVRKAD